MSADKHNNWKAYFIFSKKERMAVIVLLVILCFFTALPFFMKPTNQPWQIQMIAADSIESIQKQYEDPVYTPSNPVPQKTYSIDGTTQKLNPLFTFDPNRCTVAQWEQLGLSQRNIQTIQKYLSKGGKFKKPADIHKIYGISPILAARLEPYIKIPDATPINNHPYQEVTKMPSVEKRRMAFIDINRSEADLWKSLPGIGEKLSARIVAFREKLGGFYSVEQVGETYGLPDSTFQRIRVQLIKGDLPLKQININTATAIEMKQHPYFNWNVANAIVQFRQQHGSYSSVAAVQQIQIISGEQFQKISPYIRVD